MTEKTRAQYLANTYPYKDDVPKQLGRFLTSPRRLAVIRHALLGSLMTHDPLEDAYTPNKRWADAEALLREFFDHDAPPGLGKNSIRRFCLGITDVKHDSRSFGFLALFLAHLLERTPALWSDSLIREARALNDTIERLNQYLRHPENVALLNEASADRSSVSLEEAFWSIVPNNQTGAIYNWFFPRSQNYSQPDQSYYAILRYSTIADAIVLSFLALKWPGDKPDAMPTFSHFYQSAGDMPTTRRTEGVVLNLGSAVYFVGGGYDRDDSGKTCLSVKTMAFAASAGRLDHRLLNGVFMSTARAWQPIVGRLFLVHIGMMSEFRRPIFDTEVGIGVYDDENALEAQLTRLNEVFRYTERFPARAPFARLKDPRELASYVTRRINLCPDVDVRRIGKLFPEFQGLRRSVPIEDLEEPTK